MPKKVWVVPNVVFLGYEWSTYRPRYERIVAALHKRYPVHFLAVGRRSGQPAEDLYAGIKMAIRKSTAAIFDASRGNANVSLEFGYAEAIEKQIYLMIDSVTLPTRSLQGTPIISDLAGVRANQYSSDAELESHLTSIAENHPYSKRFEKFCRNARLRGQHRKPYLRIIRYFDDHATGDAVLRREMIDDLVRSWTPRIAEQKLVTYLSSLHRTGLVTITRGNHASARAYIS